MQIDHFTRKSLELHKSINGDKKSSLFYTINKTLTPQGARLLFDWLSNPLYDIQKIQKRLDFVEFFVSNKEFLSKTRKTLENFPDIERAISRIYMGKGGPKDLAAIRLGLLKTVELNEVLEECTELASLDMQINTFDSLILNLQAAITEENIPTHPNEGDFIKDGYDFELDELRKVIQNSNSIISTMQRKYVKDTGISNLKIKQNGVLGYFIETSQNNIKKIPYNFIHKQTLSTCIRYTTEELSIIAEKISMGELGAKRREYVIFENLCNQVRFLYENIKNVSQKISFIDNVSSLAFLAIENDYIKPTIVNENIVDIEEGRHPVVENNMSYSGERFVANNCTIDENSVISIVTGPNMGGKSTYLRQNAIIIILAQLGSYVPAKKAIIGVVDKIFSRVGASDDISSGKSTFMVEMIETSLILRQATSKSFVILDEIGRGTSTYDGLAIAWAVVEELHNNIKARTLFATHYHELKQISNVIQKVKFLTVSVSEEDGNITFLHKIKDGFANKSYGIHVAELAGFPQNVLSRARELLQNIPK